MISFLGTLVSIAVLSSIAIGYIFLFLLTMLTTLGGSIFIMTYTLRGFFFKRRDDDPILRTTGALKLLLNNVPTLNKDENLRSLQSDGWSDKQAEVS